jgi:hypothetical protein
MQVDVELAPGSSAPIAGSDAVSKPIAGISEAARAGLVRLAASQALSGRPGELALIGFTDAADSIRIDGARPGRQAIAAIVEPFEVQAADSLAGIAPRQRLVSSYSGDGDGLVDVYDFDLPQGLTARPALNYTLLETGNATVRSVEVYDWDNHTWRALPKQQVPVRAQGPAQLAPGEASQGTVRVRVREAMLHQATLSVGDQQP